MKNYFLSNAEKQYLWKKVEYKKKKKAIADQNDLFQMLNDKRIRFSLDEFLLILNSLEYSFRKKLIGLDKPLNVELFQIIQDKLPDEWFGLKYSSIKAKEKRNSNA